MERGEVWLGRVDELCPVVVLSRDEADKVRAMLVVAPAKTSIDGIAIEIDLGAREGLQDEGVLRIALPRPGRINCNWLVSMPATNLVERLGTLSTGKLGQLQHALRLAGLE